MPTDPQCHVSGSWTLPGMLTAPPHWIVSSSWEAKLKCAFFAATAKSGWLHINCIILSVDMSLESTEIRGLRRKNVKVPMLESRQGQSFVLLVPSVILRVLWSRPKAFSEIIFLGNCLLISESFVVWLPKAKPRQISLFWRVSFHPSVVLTICVSSDDNRHF